MHKVCFLDHNWLALLINNREIQRHLGVLTGTVLDLGCGTRAYERDILCYADDYVGIDWPNSFHGLHADVVANLNKPLPVQDKAADSVVSFQVLEHLSQPDVMLAEAFRILKPGGYLLISVPFQWAVHEAPWDYYRFTSYGLEHTLGKAGFRDFEVNPVTGFLPTWVLKFNYQTLRLVRGPVVLRVVVRALLLPIWFFGQTFALLLDPLWRGEEETAGYFVSARK